MIDDTDNYHDIFAIHSSIGGHLLTDHMAIHVLELNKWVESDKMNPLSQWLCFFKDSSQWVNLPNKLSRNVMRQAMKVLEDIADKEDNYYRYLKIQDHLIEQATLEKQREQDRAAAEQEKARALQEQAKAEQEKARALQEKAKAEQEKARALQEKARADAEKIKAEQAKAETERLRKLCLEHGIDPNKA